MHVAVPCGSVPEAKAEQRTNGRSFSHRKHHHWPKQLPNARAFVESQAVVRGPLGVGHQPTTGLTWEHECGPMGWHLRTLFLGGPTFSATGFLRKRLALAATVYGLRAIVK